MQCSLCGKEMKIRTGKTGQFFGCSGYPACKNTVNVRSETPKGMTGGDFMQITKQENSKEAERQTSIILQTFSKVAAQCGAKTPEEVADFARRLHAIHIMDVQEISRQF